MSDKIKAILTKYTEFKKIPFPENSKDNDEVQDVFSDLVLFDSHIAGTIEKLIDNKPINKIDLAYDESLEQRIMNIADADLLLKSSYLNYLKHLKDLILEARHQLD
jgi:hypothetical protein